MSPLLFVTLTTQAWLPALKDKDDWTDSVTADESPSRDISSNMPNVELLFFQKDHLILEDPRGLLIHLEACNICIIVHLGIWF